MTWLFADSAYYIALLLESDQDHDRAIEIAQTLVSPIVTTTCVLTEVANSLSAVRHRQTVVRLIDRLRANENVRIVSSDDLTFISGVDLYRNRPDKDWSLTDCISFVVMNREGITEALTADHHFEQAGFNALMR
ncbi:MAG: type II toxin-antitoxin system VapC family toxin [Pyrinomonadaceae bacterium]